MNNKTERINLRITKELRKKLEALAKIDKRSFSNYCEKIILEHVEAQK